MIPIVFEDDIDLTHFADEFIVKDRLASLENDVNRCLPTAKIEATEYAPFPALMYCFSIVDLLGSLYAGNARSRKTTENAARYIEKYMNYPEEDECCNWKLVRILLLVQSIVNFVMYLA